jgi:AraC family transcriptional regulator
MALTTTLPAGRFYGRRVGTRQISGIRLTESSYAAASVLPRHAHERPHFCFVLSGDYLEKIGRQAYSRRHRALTYYPADLMHAERHDSPGRHFLIELDSAGLPGVAGISLPATPLELTASPDIDVVVRLYREFRAFDDVSPMAIEGLALELLAETRRTSRGGRRQRPLWADRARELLHAGYRESLSMTAVADSVGVNPAHLARVFRREFGCTCGDYVRRLRVEFASARLASSSEPLRDLALAAGFADQSHFARTFRRLTGMTPAEYRRLSRRA